jgi:hypothetical protein
VASEELENSLRDEIDSFIKARVNDVHEQISRLQDEMNEAFMRLRDQRPDDGSVIDPSFAETISDRLRSAHEAGMQQAASESRTQNEASSIAVLKAAIDDIDDQRTQADILNMLVNRAASFAPRVVFFVVKSERIIGWRARGLEGTVGDDAVREISVPLAAETSLGEAVRTRATFSGDVNSQAENESFLNRLGGELPQSVVVVPLVVRGKAVAVLYADSNGLGLEAIKVEAIETLVRVAGMAVELLAVSRTSPAPRTEKSEAPEAVAPAPEPTPSYSPEPEPEPTHEAASESYSQEYAPAVDEYQPAAEPATAAEPEREPEAERHQPEPEPEPEPEPVNFAPQNVAQPETVGVGANYVAPLGTTRRYGGSDADLPVDVSDEERRLHNDARRFARLLVSEIKLYNEQKVREGRIQSDIYERLREDIDRSREMYDKRVAPPVAARYDYFHQEVVNTLAEGDPQKLGGAYPGATA